MKQIKRKRSISIIWRVSAIIVAFCIFVLIILWLFQTLFLEPFYVNMKEKQIVNASESIARHINDENLDEYLAQVSNDDQCCIIICDKQGYVYNSVEFTPRCIIHVKNAELLYTYIYSLAQQNGGVYTEEGAGLSDEEGTNRFEMDDRMILRASIIKDKDGQDMLVIVNTIIASVDATRMTLVVQLFIISFIVLVLAISSSLVISIIISRPISRLNEEAKKLANNDHDVKFDEKGYKEVVELARTLNYANSELMKVDKLQKELIANVSHDLRTPLTMIIGYGEVMRDLPDENTPENIQVIIDEAKRLTTLVNDMLDISKLQAGALELDIDVINLTETVRAMLKTYNTMSEYNITFDYDKDIYVEGDKSKLSQVVYNLTNNAITYTGKDKRVMLKQEVKGNRVKITVTDTGEGIAPEFLEDIWNRYYKVDKNHKRAQVGTGLGLSIVRTILDLHPNTTYGVDSTVGEGSTFWFEMEVYKQDKQ